MYTTSNFNDSISKAIAISIIVEVYSMRIQLASNKATFFYQYTINVWFLWVVGNTFCRYTYNGVIVYYYFKQKMVFQQIFSLEM